ncbi:MAG: hypothetical protein A2Y73_00420 [Chloroflexi bacterium RBG_13_56_8]|nr:MAG: hypothetical protein A2Y73_00420 [Chloroflexi bacterium RBG_13_56_8]
MKLVDVQVGDVVTLRKAHPCGTNEWEVMRIGADIGLKCHGCGRRVMLTRRTFNQRVRRFLSHAGPSPEQLSESAEDDTP